MSREGERERELMGCGLRPAGGKIAKKLTAYGRAGKVNEALALFHRTREKDQVTWNAMLSVVSSTQHLNVARQMFDQMPQKNATTYTTMIAAFSKSSLTAEARSVFESMPLDCRSVYSWTAMISCYSQNQLPLSALHLFSSTFSHFFDLGILPNSYTLSAAIKSAAAAGSLAAGSHLHAVAVKLLDNSLSSVFVRNALIHLHGKLGKLSDAELLFRTTACRDLATWNAMLNAYVSRSQIDRALAMFDSMKLKDTLSWNIAISAMLEAGRGDETLKLFVQMIGETSPNASSLAIVLSACAALTRSEFGALVHAMAVKLGFFPGNTFVCNSLISMHASCGSGESAVRVFNEMVTRDAVSFNSTILGLGQNGLNEKALEIAERALKSKLYNSSTFVAILTCCSHGRMLREGLEYFARMGETYGIEPAAEHYACVVDLLGRGGRVDEALEVFKRLTSSGERSVGLAALMAARLVHGNSAAGETVEAEVRESEPGSGAEYALLAVALAREGRREEAERILRMLREKGHLKGSGCSWLAPP